MTGAAVNRFARDDKELGNYQQNGLVKLPRRDTRALSPAGAFGRKTPLRLVAQKFRLHAFFENLEYKLN